MLYVLPMSNQQAAREVKKNHYLHRPPAIAKAFALETGELFGSVAGVVTFGCPASHNVMLSACRTRPKSVIELNRLWVADEWPRNTESWFVARALAEMPAAIIVSYADTAYGHNGYVYRALNFRYAGVTDMDRKSPRKDAVTPGKHSRDTSRNGTYATAPKVPRSRKHRYWTVTGTKRERRELEKLVTWPSMPWGEWDVPTQPHITTANESENYVEANHERCIQAIDGMDVAQRDNRYVVPGAVARFGSRILHGLDRGT